MVAAIELHPRRGLALAFNRERLLFTLIFSFAWGALIGIGWKSGWWSAVVRVVALGVVLMLVFGLFEQWPRRLPRWLARWVLQVVAVAVSVPFITASIWIVSTPAGAPPFWTNSDRMVGFSALTGLGVFLSPWVALGALVRQREALAREQALALDLARSEMERQALDARLNLLQAQVAPHFLFNTLANIQALVDAGSPQASAVLRSLVAYLRAAVPRLHEPATTLGQELELVRAYLDLMKMRMPDRLQFELLADESVHGLRCPPMTLLTLVENAVRHGIDPSEDGGSIKVSVLRQGERCRIEVQDNGAGLQSAGQGLGTGLAALRERLQLVFGNSAQLVVAAGKTRGVNVKVEFPAREVVG
ncbi:MAG TPA: histidine kinase [Steroidobacteraceae bacterium]|nr:histidine kinase [Steroidobacteraceae bacterium]HRX90360.1 histidine kinase [Steroidobacteraceae bacterium]